MLKVFKNKRLMYSILLKVCQVANGAVTIKLLTTMLTVEDFGKYSLVISISTALAVIPFTGFNQSIFRNIKEKGDLNGVITIVYVLYLLLLFFYSFLILMLCYFLVLPVYLNFSLFILISSVLLNCLFWIDSALENTKKMALIYLFDLLLKFLLLSVFFKVFTLSVEIALFITGMTSFFLFLIGVKNYICINRISISMMLFYIKDFWPYARPVVIWSIFIWAQTMIYRIYLSIYSTSNDVAFFSLLSSLSIIPISTITGVVSIYVLPRIFIPAGNVSIDYSLLKKITLFVSGGLFFSLVVVFLYHEFLVKILSSEEYIKASWMLPWLYFSKIVYGIGTIYSYRLYVEKKNNRLILANVLPGIFSIVIGFILVKYFQLNGALVSFVFSWCLCGFMCFFITRVYSNRQV